MFNNLFRTLILPVAVALLLSSCNKKLMTVLVEDPAGNVELIYAGVQSPDNLVKEIRYFPNGDTLMVTPMLKGGVHGVVTAYYKDNKHKEETSFVKGVQDGVFKRFDKDGVIVFEGSMKNGLKHGLWSTWYDETQMEEQQSYLNDQPNGKWTFWYIDGNLKREEVYELGKLIEEKNYDQ